MLPVLAEMALQMKVHPLYLMFPAALSCSMAFHTPVGMYTMHIHDKYKTTIDIFIYIEFQERHQTQSLRVLQILAQKTLHLLESVHQ